MSQRSLAVIILIVVCIAGAAWYFTRPASPPAAVNTVTIPSLSQDLYPLYSAATWNTPQAEDVVIGTTTYSGASVTSAVIDAKMDPGSIFTPFQRYYDKKLKAAGWQIANDLEAGGHVGGQSGYRKGSETILTRFHIDYHNVPANAPSECPCDVNLSLFSSSQ